MKSANVVSVRFTPAETEPSSAKELIRGSQTYTLPIDTMDLPTKFQDDLAAALAACVIANIHRYRSDGFAPAIGRLVPQLERILDSEASGMDVRARARLMNCYSVARGILFDHSGNREDLESAIVVSEKATSILGRNEFPRDWSRGRANHGLATARLGSVLENTDLLERGAEIIRDSLPEHTKDLISWTKVQLGLAFVYMQIFYIRQTIDDLQRALDVYGQIATDELRERDPLMWGAANHQHGNALVSLAEVRTDDDALARAMEAFTHTLEVWTQESPILRTLALISLASALMSLGSRQSNLDWYTNAVSYLDEAKTLVSEKHDLRIWLTIQSNLGYALSMIGEHDPTQINRALLILREADRRVSKQDIELSSKIGLNLARALVLEGERSEKTDRLEESVRILETLRHGDNLTVRNDATLLLAAAYRSLGKQKGDPIPLGSSQDVLEQLLARIDPVRSPLFFFRAQQSLGYTLRELGLTTDELQLLSKSAEVFSDGLKFVSEEASSSSWAGVQFRLSATYFEIAKRTGSLSDLTSSQTALGNAVALLNLQDKGPLARAARNLAQTIEEFKQETTLR
jgi:tetratricopeptide (TPR) repeat protein